MRGGSGGELRSYLFRKEREGAWRELERLVSRAEKSGVRSLTAEQVGRLPLLYRATLSSLSVARAISLDRNLVDYLESLCARAYFSVYGTTQPLRDAASGFFRDRFPAAVRRYRGPIALSALFLVLGTLVAHVLVTRGADWYYVFVEEEYAAGRDPAATTEEDRIREFGQRDHVRLYALDYLDRFRAAGFVVEIKSPRVLGQRQIERHALVPTEDLYICSKAKS